MVIGDGACECRRTDCLPVCLSVWLAGCCLSDGLFDPQVVIVDGAFDWARLKNLIAMASQSKSGDGGLIASIDLGPVRTTVGQSVGQSVGQ
eukprot:1127111-Pyramimonas_sp.AAC.2